MSTLNLLNCALKTLTTTCAESGCCLSPIVSSLQVLARGGPAMLLNLPAACLAPVASRQEPNIGIILRHILEDPVTLEGWMESEIRNFLTLRGRNGRDPYGGRPWYGGTNPSSRCVAGVAMVSGCCVRFISVPFRCTPLYHGVGLPPQVVPW